MIRAQGQRNGTDLITGIIDYDRERDVFYNGVQALSDAGGRYYKRLENPEVRIEKRAFGFRMTVLETGANTGVRRIR